MEEYKYRAIVDWAKKLIEERGLRAGDRFFSESELCRMHNVSRQTVRQALALMENEGLIWRKQGSGSFVQATAPKSHIKQINAGLISTYFNDYIFPSIITGIESVLTRNGVNMQLAITRNQVSEETRALNAMLLGGVDGLIVEPSKSALPNPNKALYEEIKSRNIPLIFFNAKYPGSCFPCVALDDVAAGRIVTDHLIELGHEKISAIFVFDDIQGHKRYEGFLNSLDKHSIPLLEQNIMWLSTRNRESFSCLYENRILELIETSTAIICYNDALAVSLLEFCKSHGISVPDDISIVGIDDASQAKICRVTTVRHPGQALGEHTAQLLLEAIASPSRRVSDCLYTPKLIMRDSSASPNLKFGKSALG